MRDHKNYFPKTFVILAPHTDDGEFGCGGTAAKLIERGCRGYYVAFSKCEKSLPPKMPRDILVHELMRATTKLGLPASHVLIHDFEVRFFERDRQQILETLVRMEKDLRPELVFLPSPNDLHQDHQTVAMEGLRAFKRSATILGYEMPWNNMNFGTTTFVGLEMKHVEKKIEAMKCYKSQAGRRYASDEFLRSLAVARGVQIGMEYAEAFEVLRWIIR